MKHGCTVAVAAGFIAGMGLASTAVADCNPRNPTACTDASKPQATAPQAAAAQATGRQAAKPLQLKRFMALGPARRTGTHSGKRHAARKSVRHVTEAAKEIPAQLKSAAAAETATAETAAAALTPKAVPTLSITAAPLAVAPASEDRTTGFAIPTEPWPGASAFGSADDEMPRGVTAARFDEVNAIDLAADAASKDRDEKSDLLPVSLTTPANAATPAAAPPKQSWLAWLYEKLADSVLTVVLAIRSLFL